MFLSYKEEEEEARDGSGDGGGYLSREDGRGGVEAAGDRDGGGVLIGVVLGDGGGAFKEEEAKAEARSSR